MNEPTQHAQKETGKVTARDLLRVWKQGNWHFMHGEATYGRASYSDSFVFTLTSAKESYGEKKPATETTIKVPGWVSNGATSHRKEHSSVDVDGRPSKWTTQDEGYRPLEGFWHLSYNETLPAILALLPGKAEVSFHVNLDAGTSELLVMSDVKLTHYSEQGLHGDRLYLVASWTERGKLVERSFLIDAQTSAHNSARFGNPRHDRDQGDTAWFRARES